MVRDEESEYSMERMKKKAMKTITIDALRGTLHFKPVVIDYHSMLGR